MNILKPPRLKKGDLIGVVAPAYPFPNESDKDYYFEYLRGKKELELMGFSVVEGKNIHKKEWWRAGTPKERADDINDMYKNPDVKAVIAHDGANDSISVLEYLDFDLIKNNPKPFIGFSNITNIHSAIFAKTGMVGFHMGLLTYELGKYWQEIDSGKKNIAKDYFHRILTADVPLGELNNMSEWECWRGGEVEGRLFGGNLSMIDSLIGTPYFPTTKELDGAVFFWEIDDTATFRIERILTHLKYAGILEVVSGMIIGKLVDIRSTTTEFKEPSLREMIMSILNDFHFPVLANVDFGHKIAQIPMPIGIKVREDATNMQLKFLESAVL